MITHRPWRKAFALVLIFFALSLAVEAAVRQIGDISLTVRDLDREIKFFTEVLSFQPLSTNEWSGPEQEQLTGISGARLKIVRLKLGEEVISLREFTPKGNPIPPASRSDDHWFQHIAIVVSDMDKAYAHLAERKVKHVSTLPQTLPAWNKTAGGIRAFYFRDPEDHVLEIIWFPAGKGDPKWQQQSGNLFLGIDHTAIVVSDTDRNLAFYRDLLGLRVVGKSENYGPEQEHLNQVFGARLRITSLRAEKGPGIEFLEYLAPPGGRPLPKNARPSDAIFWVTEAVTDGLDRLRTALKGRQIAFGKFSGGQGPSQVCLVRDPDGHVLQLKGRVDSGNGIARKNL